MARRLAFFFLSVSVISSIGAASEWNRFAMSASGMRSGADSNVEAVAAGRCLVTPSFELRQRRCHVAEGGQRGFEVFDDLLLQHVRRRQIVELVQTVVLQPEHIEAGLVAGDQLFIGEVAEALGFLAFVAVRRVVAGDEVAQVGDQRIRALDRGLAFQLADVVQEEVHQA